jgi:glycosyltransferase involved in cell wall biosynthesis
MADPLQAPARRIVYVVTHPITAKAFLVGQLRTMLRAGFAVTLVTSPGPELDQVRSRVDVATDAVRMRREIRPLSDLAALAELIRILRKERPDILNASTPKAAFLALLAGWITGVPVRIYTLRGLRVQTTRGLKRVFLSMAERTAYACAHRVICVSDSLRNSYCETLGNDGRKITLLGLGSSNGVDVRRLRPSEAHREKAHALRREHHLEGDGPILGFVGRLTRDKGVSDLYRAFQQVRSNHTRARLLLVGDYEVGDPLDSGLVAALASDPAVVVTGFVDDTTPYYLVMDCLALPSYREGFPNVVLEASALGVPVAAYDATGTRDAIETGRTGTLVPLGDHRGLASALTRYLTDPVLAIEHTQAARRRVEDHFDCREVWQRILREYERLLDQRSA